MTVSLALLVGAVAVGSFLPVWLRRLGGQIGPSILLVCWVLSVAGVTATGAAGVLLLLVPGHGLPAGFMAAVSGCWSSVRHGASPRIEELAGSLGLLGLVVGASRFVLIGQRLAGRRVRARQERLAVLRLAARVETGSPTILWLAHDRPLAFSMSGRPSYLVATDGLRRHLTSAQTEAVLEHERAHVRYRHHLLVGFADVLRSGFPFLALFRAAPSAVRELVELAADDAAVRRYGADTVRAALIRVVGEPPPDTSLAFGRDALEARLERLTATPGRTAWVSRGVRYGFVGATPLLPFLAAVVIFVASSTLFCAGL